jgi:4,5-dihydroxyphthalate decarboxylase
MAQPIAVRALLGDYPVTQALKKGDVKSPSVRLGFADVKTVSSAFKRVVRDLEFDCAELAIVTFLMAKAHGKPLVLLPAVVMARLQHPHIVYRADRGFLSPADLAGRRVGTRSYTVTTSTWLRGILADDYGVDLDRVKWVTFEDAHVAEFRDPPSVERAPEGKELTAMLLAGEIDAAILPSVPTDPRLKPLIPDPAAAAEAWRRKYDAIQINHMVAVKESLSKSNPDAVREIYRLLAESKKAAKLPKPGEVDTHPFGFEANRRNLEVVIDTVYRQRMIPRRYGVEELFDGITSKLN